MILLDAGLSPRATWKAFDALGLGVSRLSAILLTHLDHDHWRPSWRKGAPRHVPVHMHKRHVRRAERQNTLPRHTSPFDDEIALPGGVRARAWLGAHDDLGVAAFRIELPSGASLGYATDLGSPTPHLVDLLRGVDTLAIESNYCPHLQLASSRPEFLKERIMGGRGHLSNEQAARTIREIAPRSNVVLLHLSRECNTPELAAAAHASAPYALTLSNQYEPTPWVRIEASGVRVSEPRPFQPLLFANV